jgi:hypothetical protein
MKEDTSANASHETAENVATVAAVAVDPRLPAQREDDDIELERRFERIHRYRRLLSLMLLPPLLFFIFLVVWFREGFILIPIGTGLYLYMLAQFFVFQDPARRAHRPEAARDETQS